jgi:DNA-binding response OmpR family regulator
MERIKILLVEDDFLVIGVVESSLSPEYEVRSVRNGPAGLFMAQQYKPDLIILDIMLPGMDGYGVCRAIREDPVLGNVPILFLTAKIDPEDRINGFKAGGDDYICKPFNVDEMIWRVKALLRRSQKQNQAGPAAPGNHKAAPANPFSPSLPFKKMDLEPRLRIGKYILDTRAFELITPTRGRVRLTPMQYNLLAHLMTHPGQIFTTSELLDQVWGYPPQTGSRDLVRVHIKKLRERIEEDPSSPTFLKTVNRYGYMVEEPRAN